jgi:hypothetical protein
MIFYLKIIQNPLLEEFFVEEQTFNLLKHDADLSNMYKFSSHLKENTCLSYKEQSFNAV